MQGGNGTNEFTGREVRGKYGKAYDRGAGRGVWEGDRQGLSEEQE